MSLIFNYKRALSQISNMYVLYSGGIYCQSNARFHIEGLSIFVSIDYLYYYWSTKEYFI